MPEFVMIVFIELMNVVAVVSTGPWELKLMVDTAPVADVVVEAAPVPGAFVLWLVVPA
jgi:hypothetical protein